MNSAPQLDWLPAEPEWRPRLRALADSDGAGWTSAIALARTRLDGIRTSALDQAVSALAGCAGPPVGLVPIRLAVLGSATLAHLLPAIRVAGLRRGLWIQTYEGNYGQYLQELEDPGSPLYRFGANALLLALDPWHLAAGVRAELTQAETESLLDETRERIQRCWRLARGAVAGQILQQTVLPALPSVLGENEQRLPGSRSHFVRRLNAAIREDAEVEGVDLVALDTWILRHGLDAWHDPALWHRAKQEVSTAAAPFYGDLVARVLAARLGRSAKCLVLDLDNTIWGGVVGDDGPAGLVLGQGSALGEGFVAVQAYARACSARCDPGRLLEERREGGSRRLRRPPGDGPASRRDCQLRGQLGR